MGQTLLKKIVHKNRNAPAKIAGAKADMTLGQTSYAGITRIRFKATRSCGLLRSQPGMPPSAPVFMSVTSIARRPGLSSAFFARGPRGACPHDPHPAATTSGRRARFGPPPAPICRDARQKLDAMTPKFLQLFSRVSLAKPARFRV